MKKKALRFSVFLILIFAASFVSGCATPICPAVSKALRPSVRDEVTRGTAEQIVINNKTSGEKP